MYQLLVKIYCNTLLALSPNESNITILKNKEMVDYVLKNKLSIIRFGDGEFTIMKHKKGIHFQKYDEKLQEELEEIYQNYSKNRPFLLCVPYFLNNNRKWYKSQPYNITACFAEWRKFFRKTYVKDTPYGDAFLFQANNKHIYEKLWKDEKQLILVHNDEKWAKYLENEYNLKVIFVKAPNKNSYDNIDEIESQIRKVNDSKKIKILVSGGPMAKVLIYRLSKDGYIAYDTGHCFDEPLKI